MRYNRWHAGRPGIPRATQARSIATTMSESSSRPPWWEGDYVWRPQEGNAPEPEPIEPGQRNSPAGSEPPLIQCWRCREAVEATDSRCPGCRALLTTVRREPEERQEREPRPRRRPSPGGIVPLIWFFVGLLAVSLLQFLVVMARARGMTESGIEGLSDWIMMLTVVVEAIDTALVLLALAVIPRPQRLAPVSTNQKITAWGLGMPVLATLLALNLFYHHLLKELLGVQTGENFPAGLTPLVLLTVCVQPAVVEELFFRYLALGTLRRFTGTHGAVLVSSVMFGVAHLGAPLSIPILTIIGMAFGYLRLLSGSLLLPMVLHFMHNLVIVLLEVHS
jgi:membrane protease YdiL (CAAX protease family)